MFQRTIVAVETQAYRIFLSRCVHTWIHHGNCCKHIEQMTAQWARPQCSPFTHVMWNKVILILSLQAFSWNDILVLSILQKRWWEQKLTGEAAVYWSWAKGRNETLLYTGLKFSFVQFFPPLWASLWVVTGKEITWSQGGRFCINIKENRKSLLSACGETGRNRQLGTVRSRRNPATPDLALACGAMHPSSTWWARSACSTTWGPSWGSCWGDDGFLGSRGQIAHFLLYYYSLQYIKPFSRYTRLTILQERLEGFVFSLENKTLWMESMCTVAIDSFLVCVPWPAL